MSRIALGLCYSGVGWHGWQVQKNHPSLQAALQEALSRFLAKPVAVVCAGRTDAGVHALQQVVHLDTSAVRRPQSWVRGLNSLLPTGIAVQWACPVTPDFHARYSARSRSYLYILQSAAVRSALLHGRAGWTHRPLNLVAMQEAAASLLGEHDFSTFRAADCQARHPVRVMYHLDIRQSGDFFLFDFRANAFLHHMIRNLLGALLMVGSGQRSPAWVAEILQGRDRRLAAATFMADGLYLAHVDYPDFPGLPLDSVEQACQRHLGFAMFYEPRNSA